VKATLRRDVEAFLKKVRKGIFNQGKLYTENDDAVEAFVALGEAAMNFIENTRRNEALRKMRMREKHDKEFP